MKKNTENNELFENIENEQLEEDFGIEEEPRKNRKKGLMVAYAAVMFVALIGVGVLFTSGVGNASVQSATPTPTVAGTPKATPKATSTPKATPKPTDKAKKKAADTATPVPTEIATPQENTAGAENTATGNDGAAVGGGNAADSGAVSTGSDGGNNNQSTQAPSTPAPEKPHVHGDGCGHTWVPAQVEKVWVVDAPATPDTQEPIYGVDIVCSCGQHFSSQGEWSSHNQSLGFGISHSYSPRDKIIGYNTIPGTPEQGHWEERQVSEGYWK